MVYGKADRILAYNPPKKRTVRTLVKMRNACSFLHKCFGAIIPFEKPKIENPSRLNWINLQVDFIIEVWIEIGIVANKFLYENINAYD